MNQELINHKTKCRLCFQRISGTRNVTTITRNIQDKFFRVTNVELNTSEKFSNTICKTCTQSLNDSAKFQCKMIDNQMRLYAFEDHLKQMVKEEPPEPDAIQLDEINFEELVPKTEIFEDTLTRDQTPDFHYFEEVKSSALNDNSAELLHFEPKQESSEAGSENTSELRNVQPTGGKRKSYAPEQLYNAVEAVAAGGISILAASKKFGVPKDTVNKGVRENHYLLTDLEELQVKLYVNKRTEDGKPSSDKIIEKFILTQLLCKRRGKNREKVKSLSRTWISMFRKRHSDMNVIRKRTFELSCDICGFSVTDKKKMRIHVGRHVVRQIAPRPQKKRQYAPDVFERAMKSVAAGMSMRKAAELHGIATSSLTKYHRKLEQEKSGQEREIFKCSFCEKFFYIKSSRDAHEIENHLTPIGEFPCGKCGRIYPTQTKLNQHTKLSHRERPHECKECSEVFENGSQLLYHQSTHKDDVTCHICGKLTKEGFLFRNHMRNHAAPVECPFEDCTRMFSHQSNLKIHILSHHTEDQNIKCPQCNSTFPNKERLRVHTKRSHTEKSFVCMVEGCSYKSPRKDYLKLHLKNHKNVDVFQRDELIASLQNMKPY